MNVVTALFVAFVLNAAILAFLQQRYDGPLFRDVMKTYCGTIALRYCLAVYLFVNHNDPGFGLMFWGDSETYDYLGAAVANGWSLDASPTAWAATVEGRSNKGFVYAVAVVYYFFGRNVFLVQLLNGIIGALVPVAIMEIGLLLYNRRVATTAMVFTAFFPQMIFWSSALYKDAAVALCIALNILALLQIKERFRLSSLLVYAASAGALASLRFYIFYVLVIAAATGTIVGTRRGLLKGLFYQAAIITSLLLLLMFTPAGKIMLEQTKFFDLQALQTSRDDLATRGASGFAVDADVTTASGILTLLPVGVTYLLFAPFPWMVRNLRQLLALPDVLLWYALMPALARGLSAALREHLPRALPILVFTTALTLTYGAFLGNVGTAYRQRTQIMMFYFIFAADGIHRRRGRLASPVAVGTGTALHQPSVG